MLKKLLSMSLAALMMSSAFLSCHPDEPGEGFSETAPEKDNDSEHYANEKGASFPITLLSSGNEASDVTGYDLRYTEGGCAFASKMLSALGENENAVFSPLSLMIALQLLANGGDEETADKLLASVCPGMTREEINDSSSKLIALLCEAGGVKINSAVLANSIYRINLKYANLIADRYSASVGAIDFSDPESALAEINGWIRENTDGLITDLLDEADPDTAVIILNALTFKLDWMTPFTALRELADFKGANGIEQAEMIQTTGRFSYIETNEGRMALIPYIGGQYAMAVMLPNEGFTPNEAAGALVGRVSDCEEASVFLRMPKLELDAKLDIMEMAEALGLEEAISGSYPYLVDAGGVRVTKIVHGASLSVTEFGTTAAAATAIIAKRGAFLLNVNEMICDRPYALAIVHIDTGAVLFVSSVYDV